LTLAPAGDDRLAGVQQVAERIDQLVEQHWQSASVSPAAAVDDLGFLRRATLDLVGRVPTYREATTFAADNSPQKRTAAVERLMSSPEYALHWATVLDELIQGRFAGDREFLVYLRRGVSQHKGWDAVFREVMIGPWDADDQKPAARFLSRRMRDIDALTSDTSRVFFGVEVACAKCHDHPLVSDWTQHHYFGMASFFNRTFEFGKDKDKIVAEKDSDDVNFVDRKGNQHTAKVMFLSGRVVDEPKFVIDPKLKDLKDRYKQEGKYLAPPFSRRAELVSVALNEREFFSRAIVNHIWANLLGRGLVHPTDQMHSENPPSVPGVLEFLGDDLAAHGYALDRLIAAIASSRVYQLSSTWQSAAEPPGDELFARAPLRALTPFQFATSAMLVAGDGAFDQTQADDERAKRRQQLEDAARALTESLDRRTTNFQSSATEALFMSNNPTVQQWITPSGNSLAARLATIPETGNLIDTAVWTILGRAPDADERSHLVQWIDARQDRPTACSQLVWALVTSAEFRFNH
jgi:hypothetical protein